MSLKVGLIALIYVKACERLAKTMNAFLTSLNDKMSFGKVQAKPSLGTLNSCTSLKKVEFNQKRASRKLQVVRVTRNIPQNARNSCSALPI